MAATFKTDKAFHDLAHLGYLSARKDLFEAEKALATKGSLVFDISNLEAHALRLLSLIEYYESEVVPYATSC